MDQHSRERRLARCSQLWDAATNFRRHRTHQQDQAARRNQRTADLISNLGQFTVLAAAITVGVTVMHYIPGGPEGFWKAAAGCAAGFATVTVLTLIADTALTPILDRLRTEGTDPR